MAYEDYCAACTYLGESADYNGAYYCDRKGERRLACDAKCYSFCEAYRRSNYSRENMYDNSRSHQSSGCYLTTIMCEILNYSDDNYYLQTLRGFRDNVMKKDCKYFPLLITYDVVGPVIANSLRNDPNREEIAKVFFNNYVERAVLSIEEGKKDMAINVYVAMTKELADYYDCPININNIDICEEDINSLGHGRIKQRKKTRV